MVPQRASCRCQKMTRPSCGTQFKSVSHIEQSLPITLLLGALLIEALADDFESFNPISRRLLYAQGAPLRHVPLKIYLPSSPTASEPTSGHLRVVQSLITPSTPGSREPQTIGTALHALLPSLFPSRRTPILAKAVLHGAVVPMGALVEDLIRTAAYLDGWVHLGVVMM